MLIVHEAIAYAKRGWLVFPIFEPSAGGCSCGKPSCGDAGKHPRIAGGFKNASTGEKLIGEWWQKWPSANLGLATGEGSGVWVLDLDGAEGVAAFAGLTAKYGEPPRTPTVRSGGGGRHYYFRWTKKLTSVNRIGGLPIDRRCDGGYIIAPPSRHRSGDSYSWEIGPDDAELAAAPAWLIEWMRSAPKPVRAARAKTMTTAAPQPAPPTTSQASPPPRVVAVPPSANGLLFNVGNGAADLRSRGVAYLGMCRPSVAKTGQADACLLAAVRGLVETVGCDDSLTFELVRDHFSPRCTDEHGAPFPWRDKEILHAIDSIRATPGPGISIASTTTTATTTPMISTTPGPDQDDPEALPTPEPEPWPTLAEDAYHGIVGEIVRAIEPHTEADPAALLFQLLAAAGNGIGRGPHVFADGARHHGNLFVVVVGNSAKARKGTSSSRVRQVMAVADPAWHDHRIVSGLSSGEGLIAQVADAQQDDDDSDILKFVIPDKRLYVEEGEFAAVLEVLRREGNTLSSILRSAWDGTTIQTLTKSKLRASGAHISIAGHITSGELQERIKGRDLTNGFANRFLWVVARKSKLLARGGGKLDLGPTAKRLGVAIATGSGERKFEFTADAGAMWDQVYVLLEAEQRGNYGAVTARSSAQVLRLALIYSALDGHHAIGTAHLNAGLACWAFADASARRIFGVEPDDPLVEKVQGRLRGAGTAGMTRTDLYRSFGCNLKAALIQAALTTLLERGTARFEREDTGGQRHAERWFSTP